MPQWPAIRRRGNAAVEASRPESLQVQRHEAITRRKYDSHDRFPTLWLQEPGELTRRQLDTGDVAVVADAQLGEAQRAEPLFGSFDTGQRGPP